MKTSNLALLIALLNLLFFGAVFALMWYFELLGADSSFFDEGSLQNITLINQILSKIGFQIDPSSPREISTLMWSACLGLVFVSSCISILIANKKSSQTYEVTKAE